MALVVENKQNRRIMRVLKNPPSGMDIYLCYKDTEDDGWVWYAVLEGQEFKRIMNSQEAARLRELFKELAKKQGLPNRDPYSYYMAIFTEDEILVWYLGELSERWK